MLTTTPYTAEINRFESVNNRKLHIGGTTYRDGWEILNANQADYVDHLGMAEHLTRFDDDTFAEIYASHILEHLGYQTALPAALAEWHRVLQPGGVLMVSVPDLDTLCDLFCQREAMSKEERFSLMRMMFGGQIDSHDFHHVGLNEEFLSSFLSNAGFVDLERVSGFGLFQDCSEMTFHGRAISLNMKAVKVNSSQQRSGAVANSEQITQDQPPARDALPTGARASWGNGYYTGITYGIYTFKELAPGWIDYALLSQKQRPARQQDGEKFHYLELGSGMGLGLCLLAAAYPEGDFTGIDFHPSHIAHSQWLKSELGLENVHFQEADFLELAAQSSRVLDRNLQQFDYVVAHGIISWIAPGVRHAVFQLASSLLRPGGAFYCSYNTFPGWLDRTAFKALTDLERQRLGGGHPLAAMDQANQTLQRLFRLSTPLAQTLPRLNRHLQTIKPSNTPHYFCGEYGHEHWQPFYVSEVHQQLADHKLSYAASANLPTNHPTLLPAQLSTLLAEESDPTIRQLLLDLAINQTFRRDLFVKGPLPLSTAAQQHQLSQLRLCDISAPPMQAETKTQTFRLDTSLGTIVDDSGRILKIQSLLAQRSATLAEIHQELNIAPGDLILYVSLLLHSDQIGLDRGSSGEAAKASCHAVNRRVMELMQQSHNLGSLAAPGVGQGAQPISLVDVFALQAIQQGLDDDILSSCVWMGLEACEVEMHGPDGALLTEPDECLQAIQNQIQRFRTSTLPRLIKLGIVDPQGLPE